MPRWTEILLDHIFPRWCLSCGRGVGDSMLSHVCHECHRDIIPARPPHCSTCGYPYFGMLAGPRSCPHCAELEPAFGQGKTLFLMRGSGRDLVHDLKYRRGFYALRDIGALLKESPDYLRFVRDACLVPVPLHPAKLRERGYNQAAMIAAVIAKAAGRPARVVPLLERVRWTESQTRLDRQHRNRNMKNAFAIRPGVFLNPALHYVVVDDVFTTGATVNACCEVLAAAGLRQLSVATIGHG